MTPKMHLLVSRDILRPSWTYGLLTKEHIVVTNAHADAAAAAADAAAAKKEILKRCADIVRKHYPKVPTL